MHGILYQIVKRVQRLLKREPEPPGDPYALVGAPKKPRPPLRSASVAEPEP
ncbi:MAG: hypothetical protein ABSF25_13770 [Bryobacteraceae bacterium]|jgi:hypothetical protein